MNVPTTIDASAWLGKYLEGANGDTDLARAMLAAFAEALMSAEASMQCNAAYGERTPERENSRNGYRLRPWDTRVGSIELAVPKLRRGVYSPEFLLQPRRRAEQALVSVVCAAYVEGVSTRRVDDLVKAMGIDGISKSEVSRMAKELDQVVTEFKERPLDQGPYRYLWIDALTQRVREGGRVVNVSAVIATAVGAEGRREIVGLDIATTEDTAAWTAFLRALVARGLSGVELVISDAHGGIKAAIAQVFAEASWQRCRTHFMANLASRCAKGNWPMIATLVRSIFEQPDRDTTWSPAGRRHRQADPGRLRRRRHLPARRGRRHLGLQRLPHRALATDPLEQPSGTTEQGDPPAHRRRGHLPQPRGRHPTGRRTARRADRRVGHHPALHERRVAQDPEDARALTRGPEAGHRRRRRGGRHASRT